VWDSQEVSYTAVPAKIDMPLVFVPGYPILVSDMVCGRVIDIKTAEFTTKYEGKTYRFCSETCLREFTKYPTRFAGKANRPAK
jgi:YHS domain-containing protein